MAHEDATLKVRKKIRQLKHSIDELLVLVEHEEPAPDPEPEPEPTPEPEPGGLVIAPPVGPFTEVDGGGTVSNGVYYGAYELEAPRNRREIKKVHAHHHTNVNAGAMWWNDGRAHPTDPPVLVEDCILEDASRPTPGSANGTGEANLWAGCTGTYRRFVCRRGAWMGLWTGGGTTLPEGGCYGSVFEDFEVLEQGGVGIYLEHTTRFCVFRNFRVTAGLPITLEWWYGDGAWGTHDVVFEDFELTVTDGDTAVFVDSGNYGVTLRNGVVRGGKIVLATSLVDPSRPNVVENVVDENGDPVVVEYYDYPHDFSGTPPPNNPPSWWTDPNPAPEPEPTPEPEPAPADAIHVRTTAELLASRFPGDVVVVHAGDYGSRGSSFTFPSSGIDATPIVYQRAAGEAAPRLLGSWRLPGDHVTLDGLLFDGPTGLAGRHPLEINSPPHSGLRILNCEVRDSDYHAGIFLRTGSGTGNEIDNCHVHGTTDAGDPNPEHSRNHGIYWASGTDIKVTNCLLENNHSWGLHFYSGPISGGLVEGNVIRGNRGGGMVLDDQAGPISDVLIRRNEFRDNLRRGGINVGGGGLSGAGNVADDNLFCANEGGDKTGGSGLEVRNSRHC